MFSTCSGDNVTQLVVVGKMSDAELVYIIKLFTNKVPQRKQFRHGHRIVDNMQFENGACQLTNTDHLPFRQTILIAH